MSRFISWALGLGTAALLLPVVGRAEPTMMPPFLVEEPVVAPEWHWIHATDGQFEVLSACSLTESQNFMRLVRRRVRALERVVPDDFQQHTTLPTTLILFPSSQKKSLGEEFNRLLGHSGEPDAPRGRFQAMEDLRLVDADSSAIFVFLEEWQWEPFSGQQGMRPTSIMPRRMAIIWRPWSSTRRFITRVSRARRLRFLTERW